MVDKIEMSLDDIIKSSRKIGGRPGGRRPGGVGGFRKNGGQKGRGIGRSGPAGAGGRMRRQIGQGTGAIGGPKVGGGTLKGRSRGGIQKAKFNRPRGDVNSAWKHDLYDGPKRAGMKSSAKILVSNLDYGVSESDIKELFGDLGPLKNASVHYDRSGRSLGTAEVVFERRVDALKSMKQYNGVPLDGRPMNIQLATSELPTLRKGIDKSRLGGAISQRGGAGGGGARGGQRSGPRRGGANVARGGGGRRPGGVGVGNRLKQTKTAEELDAELDAYVNDMRI